jgi:hypothetical protein
MLRIIRFAVCSLVLAGCVGSEVSPLGKAKYAARPKGCAVTIFPSTTPDYAWTDIASAKARCHFTHGREACIEELREQTCKLGGDTIYGFTDGVVREDTIVIATIAKKKRGARKKKKGGVPPASAPEQARLGCDPPCSPGYACQNAQCIALCNPACGEGARCNQQRVCEPVPAAAGGDSAATHSESAP